MDLLSMFLLGFLGTAHCLGMCGPLILALSSKGPRFGGQLAYHLGRVVTYSMIGATSAAAGAGLMRWTAEAAADSADTLGVVTRVQVLVSLLSALVLLAFGLMRLQIIREPMWLAAASPGRLPLLGRSHRWALARGDGAGMFILGLIFGLLPCGLSYAAFARVLTVGSMVDGAGLVAAFGVGTIPGLLLLGTGGAAWARRHQRWADLLSGLILIAMALSVGLDGLQALL